MSQIPLAQKDQRPKAIDQIPASNPCPIENLNHFFKPQTETLIFTATQYDKLNRL